MEGLIRSSGHGRSGEDGAGQLPGPGLFGPSGSQETEVLTAQGYTVTSVP